MGPLAHRGSSPGRRGIRQPSRETRASSKAKTPVTSLGVFRRGGGMGSRVKDWGRLCPLLGVKRLLRSLMSANDPKRTSAAQALAAPGAEQYAPAALPPHSTKQSDRVW
jgi:hypothetical protein